MLSTATNDEIDWECLRSKTEGYVASDLDKLLSRALHAYNIRSTHGKSWVT